MSNPSINEYELSKYNLDENATLQDLVNAKLQKDFIIKLSYLDPMEALAYSPVLSRTLFTLRERRLIQEHRYVNQNNEIGIAYSVDGSNEVYFYEGKNKTSLTTMEMIKELGYLLWEAFK